MNPQPLYQPSKLGNRTSATNCTTSGKKNPISIFKNVRHRLLDRNNHLPPNKRWITGHDSSGKSIFKPSPPQLYRGRENIGGVARSYSISQIPCTMKDEADIKAYRNDDPAKEITSFKGTDIVVPNGTGAKSRHR